MSQANQFAVLGEKPIGELLSQYALPAIIAMVASSLYNIVDGIFVGQGVGEAAITGLALTNPLMALSSALGAMVGVGGATLMSMRLGQQDYNSARLILGNVIVLNAIIGVVFGLAVYVFLTPVLEMFGASSTTLPYARDYMQVLLYGNVFTHLYFGLNAQLRATNRPLYAMCATFGSVIINSALDALFIFGFGWGIKGAAWATVIAQVTMLAWQFKLFMNPKDAIHLTRDILRPHWRTMRETLTLGMPQFLVNACSSLISIVITRSMAEYGGDTSVGAYGITNRWLLFIVFITFGFVQGMQPIASYNYGAQKYDRVIRVVLLTIAATSVVTTLGFCVCMFFTEACVSIFAKDAPQLVGTAVHGLRIAVLMLPFVGLQIVSSSFFQCIGQPSKSIFLSLTRQLIFLVPCLFILPHFFEEPSEGIWYAMPISDAAAILLSVTLLVLQIRKFRRSSTASTGTPPCDAAVITES